MLDLAGPYLFGGDYNDFASKGICGEELYAGMLERRPEVHDRLWDFIYSVQARGLEDAVLREPEEFIRMWTSTDFQTHEEWKNLDAHCRLREDLDLFWVSIPTG